MLTGIHSALTPQYYHDHRSPLCSTWLIAPMSPVLLGCRHQLADWHRACTDRQDKRKKNSAQSQKTEDLPWAMNVLRTQLTFKTEDSMGISKQYTI